MAMSEGVSVGAAMVVALFLDTSGNTLMKSATNDGMSVFIYTFYSNLLALCFLLPATFFYHRKRSPPPMTNSIFFRVCFLSCITTIVQTLINTGIGYSSPTLASAMLDLIPAFTFILAVISRMENVNLKEHRSQAKIIGTVVSIAGALIVTLYKGIPLISIMGLNGTYLSLKSDWLLGAMLLATSSFSCSVLFVVQTWIMRDYPQELVVTTICFSLGVILYAIVALVAEGTSKAWILGSNKELMCVCFSGICVASVRNVIFAWALRKKGPIYVAMFTPIGIVIAIGLGVIFLGDNLYLGSMIGAGIIAIGFYAVMWAQTQEEHTVSENNVPSSSSAPLLPNKGIDF